MKNLLLVLLFWCPFAFGQLNLFQDAYALNPSLPEGILETYSWSRTRFKNLDHTIQPSCVGVPEAIGIMGLFEDGKSYFNENAKLVATISGVTIEEQRISPENQINAFAKAFASIYNQHLATINNEGKALYLTLFDLSEIPSTSITDVYAKESQIFEILRWMNDPLFMEGLNLTSKNYNLNSIFGKDSYAILNSKRVFLSAEQISNTKGEEYLPSQLKSTDYGPAIWDPAPSCNFSSRSGTPVSAITIHTIQGTYAGAISWAKNCASNVSYHYVIRSSDGQVTQMVLESDKGWHVGSENPYTIGYEHDGYVDDPSWLTTELYEASAAISRDIVGSGYGIPSLRTYFGPSSATTQLLGGCTKIKGHQHYPNQTHTDPGINWDWERYYKLINNTYTPTLVTSATGSLFDSGGEFGNYTDDERSLWLIQPTDAATVTLNFSAFDLEVDYDYLFIYDGATPDDALIGKFTGTNSPGIVTSTGGAMLIEFRSDCATVNPGWAVTYTSEIADVTAPITSIENLTDWQTADFNVGITDTDSESGIAVKYYLVGDKQLSDNGWSANTDLGFALEDFEDNTLNWTIVSGSFDLATNVWLQGEGTNENTNAYLPIDLSVSSEWIFEWDQNITSNYGNQRAGLHFMCSDPTLPNRGESYFVYLRENGNAVQIYRVTGDAFSLEVTTPMAIEQNTTYHVRVTYSAVTGLIKVYVDGNLINSWQDPSPLTTGNSISLRSGGCAVEFDNVKVFHERSGDVTILNDLTGMMRYESEGAIESGKIIANSIDLSGNWSSDETSFYLIDRSAPIANSLEDGNALDIDTTTSTTLFSNWDVVDIHSDIVTNEVALGTTVGGNDILDWTNVGSASGFSHTLLAPINNQVYYYSLRSTNGAGLTSVNTTDGQRLVTDLSLVNESLTKITLFPNPTTDVLHLKGVIDDLHYQLYNFKGQIVINGNLSVLNPTINVSQLAQGEYTLMLIYNDAIINKQIIKH